MWKQMKKGFTLIELLVVISIIGVLAGLLFTNFSGARERARDIKRKSDLQQVKNALRLYYNDYQKYPADNGGGKISGCGVDGTSVCEWGSPFTAGAGQTVYLNQLPTDPISTQTYLYTKTNDEIFLLQASLENLSDDSAVKSQVKCGIPEVNAVLKVYMVCSE